MRQEERELNKPLERQVSSSILSASYIESEIARRYDLGAPCECDLFSHGRGDTYRIKALGRSYFLKIYEVGGVTKERAMEEVRALLHLRSLGMSVAYPVACKENTHFVELPAPEGSRVAVLYTQAAGDPLNKHLTPESCKAYGDLLAKLHRGLDDVPEVTTFFGLLDVRDEMQTILRYLNGRVQIERFGEIGRQLDEALHFTTAALTADGLHMGLCHGDVHDFNVHIDASGKLTLFDFEEFHIGWRAFDLATFLRVLIMRHEGGLGMMGGAEFESSRMYQCWLSFLSGYDQVRPLAAVEHRAIYAFVPIRRVLEMGWVAKNARVFGSKTCRPKYFDRGIDFIEMWMRKYRSSIYGNL